MSPCDRSLCTREPARCRHPEPSLSTTTVSTVTRCGLAAAHTGCVSAPSQLRLLPLPQRCKYGTCNTPLAPRPSSGGSSAYKSRCDAPRPHMYVLQAGQVGRSGIACSSQQSSMALLRRLSAARDRRPDPRPTTHNHRPRSLPVTRWMIVALTFMHLTNPHSRCGEFHSIKGGILFLY